MLPAALLERSGRRKLAEGVGVAAADLEVSTDSEIAEVQRDNVA
jgi:hypothetical protein